MLKRLFDILSSGILLVLTSPLMLIAMAGIKLTSAGPVFYKADRMGRGKKPFAMHKFRTMHVRKDGGSQITAPNDARIFPFGNFLRRSKIDELPQLWNVLTGDMSIVGPRPESVSIVHDSYTDWMLETLKVRPGVTSPGAIFGYTHGDHVLDDDDPEGSYLEHMLAPKLAIELGYIEHANIFTDFGVMFRTAAAIIAIILGKRHFPLPLEAGHAQQYYDFKASRFTGS